MATYESVSWQNGDEVTSTKLDQMARNGDWLKDNLIFGDAIRVGNGDLVPSPMTIGSSKIKRIDAKVKPFNSQVPVTYMDVDVNLPKGYTNPPIIIPAVSDVHGRGYGIVIARRNGNHSITFRIYQLDSIAKIISGMIHVLFVNY